MPELEPIVRGRPGLLAQLEQMQARAGLAVEALTHGPLHTS